MILIRFLKYIPHNDGGLPVWELEKTVPMAFDGEPPYVIIYSGKTVHRTFVFSGYRDISEDGHPVANYLERKHLVIED